MQNMTTKIVTELKTTNLHRIAINDHPVYGLHKDIVNFIENL